jgi:hypothetical protein
LPHCTLVQAIKQGYEHAVEGYPASHRTEFDSTLTQLNAGSLSFVKYYIFVKYTAFVEFVIFVVAAQCKTSLWQRNDYHPVSVC